MDEQFAGSKEVTCAEANKLLNNGKAYKALYRPNGPIRAPYSDDDPAYVWLVEK